MLLETTFFDFEAARYVGDEIEPDYRQMLLAQEAIRQAAALRETMSRLTTRQQTAMLREFRTWGVFIDAKPASEPNMALTGAHDGSHHEHKVARAPGAP